jgi:C4-dicarboxylate transporter
MWVKNTSGKKDAMLTFATFSFAVVTLNILLSTISSLSIGDKVFEFQLMDSAAMATYLAATFSAYVTRRWTDKKYTPSKETTEDQA